MFEMADYNYRETKDGKTIENLPRTLTEKPSGVVYGTEVVVAKPSGAHFMVINTTAFEIWVDYDQTPVGSGDYIPDQAPCGATAPTFVLPSGVTNVHIILNDDLLGLPGDPVDLLVRWYK